MIHIEIFHEKSLEEEKEYFSLIVRNDKIDFCKIKIIKVLYDEVYFSFRNKKGKWVDPVKRHYDLYEESISEDLEGLYIYYSKQDFYKNENFLSKNLKSVFRNLEKRKPYLLI